MLRWLRCLSACLLGAMVLGAGAAAEGPRGALKIDGYVSDGSYDGKALWFALSRTDARFIADPDRVPNPDALWKLVLEANKQGHTLAVWYDPDTGEIDHTTMLPVFIVRSVVFDGQTVAGDIISKARRADSLSARRDRAEFAVARGFAAAKAGQSKAALPLLNEALSYSDLAVPLKAIAVKARTSILEDDALAQNPPGDQRDRALFDALADARAWRKAAPNDAEAELEEAWLLTLLGGYDESFAIYDDVNKRWPGQDWLVLRRMAALHRRLGHVQQSLEWLDKLAAVPGNTDTMPYHYHRGWTLDELGKPDEAIAEYTAGLKFQPDYNGAFWRRACSYAVTGRLQLALDDFREARKLRDGFLADIPVTPGLAFDATRYAEAEQSLAAALANDPHQKVTGLCKGYWDWGEDLRSRSKMLPPKP